jgi:hypothetical protein
LKSDNEKNMEFVGNIEGQDSTPSIEGGAAQTGGSNGAESFAEGDGIVAPRNLVLAADRTPLLYRITGPQSIERLTPLLLQVFANDSFHNIEWIQATDPTARNLSFVWETACEKAWDEAHKRAVVLDRLSNSQIIEDKANLAYLQQLITANTAGDVPVLDTYLASNANSVRVWAANRWMASDSNDFKNDWWAVKAARGNGGKDVWFINYQNYIEITTTVIPQNEEYVVQRYVNNPLLWRGTKKFHFRCYGSIHADMSAMLYRHCYVLTASADFDISDTCVSNFKHITNLSVNKHSPGHPGQIPCCIASEFPEVRATVFEEHVRICFDCECVLRRSSKSCAGCGLQ